MRLVISIVLVLFMSIKNVQAFSYIEDVKNFGYVSGEGLACNAKRYPAYETIVRAYIISAARSDKEQREGMLEFNSAKASSFVEKRQSNYLNCDNVNRIFNRQRILRSTLYKDGRIKFPDGKTIIPRKRYDATKVYDRTENEREKMNAFYDEIIAKKKVQAQKEGIFQKIRQDEMKNMRR